MKSKSAKKYTNLKFIKEKRKKSGRARFVFDISEKTWAFVAELQKK